MLCAGCGKYHTTEYALCPSCRYLDDKFCDDLCKEHHHPRFVKEMWLAGQKFENEYCGHCENPLQ